MFKMSEEHGWLKISGKARDKVKLGDKLEFIPYHVCPCVNQFDVMYVLENDVVRHTWKIKARRKDDVIKMLFSEDIIDRWVCV